MLELPPLGAHFVSRIPLKGCTGDGDEITVPVGTTWEVGHVDDGQIHANPVGGEVVLVFNPGEYADTVDPLPIHLDPGSFAAIQGIQAVDALARYLLHVHHGRLPSVPAYLTAKTDDYRALGCVMQAREILEMLGVFGYEYQDCLEGLDELRTQCAKAMPTHYDVVIDEAHRRTRYRLEDDDRAISQFVDSVQARLALTLRPGERPRFPLHTLYESKTT